MSEECHITQLIDGTGEFNVNGLEQFVDAVKLSQYGLSYAVVAIMGPQSGGKSTLLNHLFYTNFREMDAYKGRTQTTKGIWIAKAIGMKPCTIVLDLEGTDGRERGEDDTSFEKQSALFALAIADIVLINMWCHDIGREHAANKPLLKTVFQVMMRLFTPRKTTLMFVIRDITKTPLKHLEPILKEDIQKIWDLVSKPQVHKETPFSDFFNVEVTALSSYEEKEEQFKEQVARLRERFYNSIVPGGLAGDRQAVVPASAFSVSAQQIWQVIRENKDLDLPSHKIMVATIRCEDIAKEKLIRFTSDEGWVTLEEAVQVGPVAGFGEKLSSILETYLTEYDVEAIHFDESVKSEKRKQLESKALDLVYPAYTTMLGQIRSKALQSFKIHLDQKLNEGVGFASAVRKSIVSSMHEFDQGCAGAIIKQASWDGTKVREKLCRDIDAHALSVRSAKLSETIADFEKKLTEALYEPVKSLLETGRQDTWTSIRKLLKRETGAAVSRFSIALASFELDQTTFDNMVQNLRVYAKSVVQKKAREEAGRVLIHMKERFSTIFNHDNDSLPRVWTGKVDIRKITKDARTASLQLLSVMAAIRLDEKSDRIENILSSSLMDRTIALPDRRVAASADPLASSTWEEVPSKDTLITPVQCKSLWRQFIAETEYTVTQAISAQETHRRSNNWLPPPWAILAMIILGFNEFMLLVKNPLYLAVFFVVFLLSKALWVQTDIAGEFRNGTLAGLLSISSRFIPRLMNLVRRLAEEAQWRPTSGASQQSQYAASQSFRNQSSISGSISGSFRDSSLASHISSAERDIEYSSPNLKLRRATTVQDTELF